MFRKTANFPKCLGAIDGKHVTLLSTEHSGSTFYNYKGFYSVVLLAVADSNYRFLFVDVGSVGKSGDPTVFKGTLLLARRLKKALWKFHRRKKYMKT